METYLRDDARGTRENNNNITAVHLLLDRNADSRIAGFFTLSSYTVIPSEVPQIVARKLPRYDKWGCLKLGRMARDDSYSGLGIGPILIANAFGVSLSVARSTGSFALVVDAKNGELAKWYSECGFQPLTDKPLTLFVVNTTMAKYLAKLQ